MKNPTSILLALDWYDHRLLQGIADYAAEHDWHISSASMTREHLIPYGWQGDGVLTWQGIDDKVAEFVLALNKPTVDFSFRRPELPFAHVLLDHFGAAKLAADHFIERGIEHFVFYSDDENWKYVERGQGFIEALRWHNHSCTWLKANEAGFREEENTWPKRRAWVARKLRNLPKPVGIFTASGTQAVEIQEVCRAAELNVPDEVAIIGIEDDLLLPQAEKQGITAVEPNIGELGYRGAELLDRLLHGHPVPKEPIRIPPARLITRRSTDITAVRHPALAKALRYIDENYAEKIDTDSIAKAAGISVRSLHQLFLKHLHRSPGEHLRAARIEHVKTLLAETDTKIEAVATMCGFRSINSFFVSFKQAVGTSPHEYRKEAQRSG